MDRKLIGVALLLLSLSLTYLLADLGLLGGLDFGREGLHSSQTSLGKVSRVQKNVRRRAQNSIIWQGAETNTDLFSYDSVLTLSQSAALLELENQIRIDLHENTLVVLEPLNASAGGRDSSFRLQFYRGDLRSRSGSGPLSLGSGEWTLEAQANSDISLRRPEGSEGLEVEVSQGEVVLRHRESQELKSISSGTRLQLGDRDVLAVEQIDDSLSWRHTPFERIYSHHWPKSVELRWSGPADRLVWGEEVLELSPGQQSLSLELKPGTHRFRLLAKTADKELSPSRASSSTLTLNLWPAPRLRHLSPLPRDRVRVGENFSISWLGLGQDFTYQLKLKAPGETEPKVSSKATPLTEMQHSLSHPGAFEWSIQALDEEGFVIPPFYSYPLFSVPDPLQAPRLRAPTSVPIRPSTGESSSHRPVQPWPPTLQPWAQPSALWTSWLSRLLLPSAQASTQKRVLLSWDEVPGADHYVIEIDDNPQFESPLLTQKQSRPEFLWTPPDDKKVHYYRVAAGREDGQMGLFSEVMAIDPNQWSIQETAENAVEGPPESLAESTAPPAQSAASTQSTLPPGFSSFARPAPSAPPERPPSYTSSPKTEEEPRPLRPPRRLQAYETRFVLEFWYSPSLLMARQRHRDQDLDISFAGLSPSGAGLRLSFPQAGVASWHLQLEGQSHFWQAKESHLFPQQAELKDQQISAQILRRGWQEQWAFGLKALEFQAVERLSPSQIEMISLQALGLAGEWEDHFRGDRHQLRLGVSLFAGEKNLYAGQLQGRWLLLWPLISDSQLGTGLQLNSFLWQQGHRQGQKLQGQLILSWQW